jgi:hypothetical protein
MDLNLTDLEHIMCGGTSEAGFLQEEVECCASLCAGGGFICLELVERKPNCARMVLAPRSSRSSFSAAIDEQGTTHLVLSHLLSNSRDGVLKGSPCGVCTCMHFEM